MHYCITFSMFLYFFFIYLQFIPDFIEGVGDCNEKGGLLDERF